MPSVRAKAPNPDCPETLEIVLSGSRGRSATAGHKRVDKDQKKLDAMMPSWVKGPQSAPPDVSTKKEIKL
jgi:hypothetical protein